jgi:hypothetical protein
MGTHRTKVAVKGGFFVFGSLKIGLGIARKGDYPIGGRGSILAISEVDHLIGVYRTHQFAFGFEAGK